MTVAILGEAENDLERAFDYYESQLRGLGIEMLDEFRRGIEKIQTYPRAWQPLDDVYRRYRLHRFPYGIVYRILPSESEILVVAVMHLSERPGAWRTREPS